MEHFTPSEAPIHETQRLPVAPPAPQIIGRNQELGQTFAQVRAGTTVLLHGPRGVGKSALAATIAAAFTAFPGGVVWWPVEFDSLERLLARLGRAFGLRTLSDSPSPLAHVGEVSGLVQRHNKPLLVLDGRLDLDVAREFVRKVAEGTPAILINDVGGPGPWTPVEVGPLAEADAQSLFMRAAGIAPDHVSTIARANIQTLCQRLGRLPLALVLAGQHVRASEQTPGDFLAVLSAEDTDSPAPGLAEIFRQLPDPLQGMLLVIGSTFAGQATMPLLEQLNPAPPETITRVMEMLMQRGLVQHAPGQGEDGCYYLHDVVHAFVHDWLDEAGHLEALTSRAQNALLTFAEENHAASREARTRLVGEMPNLIALARLAYADRDTATVRQLVDALASAFADTGGYGYELHRLEQMLPPAPEPAAPPVPVVPAAPVAAADPAAPVLEDPQATLDELTQMAFPGLEDAPHPEAGPPVAAGIVPEPAPAEDTTFDTAPLRPLTREKFGPPPERVDFVPAAEEVAQIVPAPAPPEPAP
ncbi:MAG: hypothetical protein JW910_03140, partial [Anaerolineae bacterium]|nr:hypothetical protein [Anaerolineae bacterium]